MATDISARIGLDGLASFRQASNLAVQQAKNLEAQMKALTAQFGTADKSEQALTARNKVLSDSLNQAKERSSLYKSELDKQSATLQKLAGEVDRLTKEHGENSAEVDKAKSAYASQAIEVEKIGQKYNGAEADINKFSRELDENESALNDVKRGFNDAGQRVDEFGNVVKDAEGDVDGFGKKGSSSIKDLAVSLGLLKVASAVLNELRNSMNAAIERVDTLNRFPKILESMGVSASSAKKSVNDLAEGVKGLPTALNDIVTTTQRFFLVQNNIDLATGSALALNNALFASGATAEQASRGTEQYVQALAKGKPDQREWLTLQETMGYAIREVAAAFGYAGDSAIDDFGAALKSGDISMTEFNDKLIELNSDVGGFADKAKTATGGIGTAWTNLKTAVVRETGGIVQAIDTGLSKTRFKSIENVIGEMQEGVSAALKAVAKAFGFLAENIEVIGPVVLGLVTAFAAFKVTMAVTNGLISAGIKSVGDLKVAFNLMKEGVVNSFRQMDTAAKATLVGAIAGLVVAVAGLAESFLGASQATEDFKDDMEALADSAEAMATDFAATNAALAINADKARSLTGDIAALNEKITSGGLSTGELAVAQAELSAKTMEYNAAVGEEALKIDSVTGAIVGGTDAIAKNTDALIENAKRQAEVTAYEDAYKAVTQAQSEQAGAIAEMKAIYNQLSPAQQKAVDMLEAEYEATGSLSGATDTLTALWYASAGAGKQANNELRGLIEGTEDAIAAEKTATAQTQTLNGVIVKNEEARKSETQSIEEQKNAIKAMTTESGMNLDMMAQKWGMTKDEITTHLLETGGTLDEFNETMKTTHTDMGESVEDLAAKWGVSTEEIQSWIAINESDVQGWKDHMMDIAQQYSDAYVAGTDKVVNGFKRLPEEADVSLEELAATLTHNRQQMESWEQNLTEIAAIAGPDMMNAMRQWGPEYNGLLEQILADPNGELAQQVFNDLELAGVSGQSALEGTVPNYEMTGMESGNAYAGAAANAIEGNGAPAEAAKTVVSDVSDVLENADYSGITTAIANAITAGKGSIDAAMSSVVSGMQTTLNTVHPKMTTSATTAMTNIVTAIKTAGTGSIRTAMTNVVNTMYTALTSGISRIRTAATSLVNAIMTTLNQLPGKVGTTGTQVMNTLADELGKSGNATSAIRGTMGGVVSTIRGYFDSMYSAMGYLMRGMVDAMKDYAPQLYAQARTIANNISNTLRKAWKEHSPSKVSFGIMGYYMKGLLNSMIDGAKDLYRMAETMSDKISDKLTFETEITPLISDVIPQALSAVENGIVMHPEYHTATQGAYGDTIYIQPNITLNTKGELTKADLKRAAEYTSREIARRSNL